ncbi:hypothetical protein ACWN83_00460 [Pseudolactococcus plantarum]|nr:hypothetical protein [Lactococcus plantarum]
MTRTINLFIIFYYTYTQDYHLPIPANIKETMQAPEIAMYLVSSFLFFDAQSNRFLS